MNMKTTKFLAVLAVMAFAFIAFAAVAPAETQDASNTESSDWTFPDGSKEQTATLVDTTSTQLKETKNYVVNTKDLTFTTDTSGQKVVYLVKGINMTLTISSSATVKIVPVTISDKVLTYATGSEEYIILSGASSTSIAVDANGMITIGNAANTISGAVIPANGGLTIANDTTVSGVVKNAGTITVAGESSKLTVSGTEASITRMSSTSSNGTLNIVAAQKSAVKLTEGTISYQNITTDTTLTGDNMGQIIQVGGTQGKTVNFTNNNVTQKSKYNMYVLATATGQTVNITDNIFTCTYTQGAKSTVQVSQSTATMGNSTKVTLTGNDFSSIPQAMYEAQHSCYKFIGNGYSIVTAFSTTGTTPEVKVDSTGLRAEIQTEDANKTITIAGNISFTSFNVREGKVLIAEGATVTLDGTGVVAKKDKVNTTLTVEGTLKNKGELTIAGADATLLVQKKSGGNVDTKVGVTGLTGLGTVVINASGTLTVTAFETISQKNIQANTNTIKIMNGGAFTGFTTTIFEFTSNPAQSSENYVLATFNGSESYTSATSWPGFTYDICANITTATGGVSDFGLAGDVFNVTDGFTLALGGTLTIPAKVVLNVLEGATVSGSAILTNNGTINYATAGQYYTNIATGSTGTIYIDGSDDIKTTTETDLDTNQFDDDYVIATGAVTKVTPKAGQEIVLEDATKLANVNISKTGSIVSMAASGKLPTAGVTITDGTNSVVLKGEGMFSFAKGSLIIDGDIIATTTYTIADGKTIVVSGTATTAGFTFALAEDATSADIIVSEGKTLKTTSGSIIIPVNATMTVYGTLAGNVVNNGTLVLMTGGDISAATVTGSGKFIDNTDDDDMKEVVIGGDSMGKDTVYSAQQKVVVSTDLKYWNLNKDSDITIKGALVIPEGTVMTVQAGAELIIDNNAKVYVYGKLIIDGIDGAVAAGKISLTSGTVSVEGTVTLDGNLVMANTTPDIAMVYVADGGEFTVGDDGAFTTATNSVFFVDAGGELEVNGSMGTVLYNSGLITIDSDVAVTTPTEIKMKSPGATVDVVSYTIKATSTAKLTISDSDLVFTTYKSGTTDKSVILKDTEDKIVISMSMTAATEDYSISFSGLEVVAGYTTKATEKSDDADKGIYNKRQYYKNLDVSGTFYADYTYIGSSTGVEKDITATVAATIETGDLKSYCSVKVSDDVVINDYITLDVAAGEMTVTGSISTMSKDAYVTNNGTITVSGAGKITCVVNPITSENNINAAKFVTVSQDIAGKTYKIYNYYSIDGALAVVSEELVTSEIIVLGKQSMTVSADLPAEVTLVLFNSSSNLTIKSDVEFKVAYGATVKGEGKITVDGTMYASEKTDVKSSVTIISDVKTEEIDEKGKPTRNGWAMWTNLANAIAEAEPGSIVTLTKTDDKAVISKNMTIPEGVTLEIPEGTVGIVLKNGITLTIDGIVDVGSNIFAEQAFGLDAQSIKGDANKCRYSSAIVVNGALISTSQIVYGDGAAAGETAATKVVNNNNVGLIGGKYAQNRYITVTDAAPVKLTDNVDVTAPIAGAYYTVKDGNATYYVISTLAVAAENLDAITSDITVHGEVAGLVLSFEKTDYFDEIVVPADAGITAPTSVASGNVIATELAVATLVLDEVAVNATAGIVSGIIGNGTAAMTFADAKAVNILDKDDKLYVYGSMTATTAGALASVTAGTVYLGYDNNAFTYTGGTENYLLVADDAEAVVENGGTIDLLAVAGYFGVPANKTITVTTLVDLGEVEVAATTETSAKGTLSIGTLYLGADNVPKDAEVFATAAISGPISITTKAYAMGDAVIGLDTAVYLATLYNTTFYIEAEEFYTVFAVAATVSLDSYMPLIPEAKILSWMDEDGNVIKFDSTAGTPYVGKYDAAYAYIDYNIYSVQIVTDAGVKSVAINGIELVNSQTNVFVLNKTAGLTPLKTGTYKVTYTLKSGYQEDKNGVILYTSDGTVLANHSFVASGSYGYDTIYLQLNGTEIIPEPEPVTPEEQSEWTITTILLCVLVVLIAIMAVIVALRLNRN